MQFTGIICFSFQLAAFRKKRAKKKKVRGDGGEGEKVETGTNSSCVEVSPVDVSSASDLNSLTGEVSVGNTSFQAFSIQSQEINF